MRVEYRTDLELDDAFAEIAAPGTPGVDGIDGVDGKPGSDGTPGADGVDGRSLNFRGEWKPGSYLPSDVVTDDGSSFVCLRETKTSPPGKAWRLIAARGEEGKPGPAGRGPRGFKGDPGESATSGGGTPTAFIADAIIDAGQALIVSSAGHCELASASDIATAAVVGLAVADVGSGLAGILQTGDVLTLDDWSDATGSASLSAGLAYYLSESLGMFTTTPPTGEGKCVTYIGRATDTQSLLIEVGQPVILSEEPEE